MSIKKLGRIAILAFAVAVLLAVSSLAAYSVTINGTVDGLESGVSYTAAQYDFANNAYGEFEAIDGTTVLTAGVWGIKAGDAEPVALFVQGVDSGRFNFWDEETAAPGAFFKGKAYADGYVPGYWSVPANNTLVNVTYYSAYPSICIHVSKPTFLNKAEKQKTVTVDGASYPLYTIDGAEYYLKEEAYYAVADNALYEGEGEAVAVTQKGWPGATPILGEANKLAEANYNYGFTNDQVIPVSSFDGFISLRMGLSVGSVSINTDLGYSANHYAPKVVFYTKTIGSDEVTVYTGVSSYNNSTGAVTVTSIEDAPADAYIVGVGFYPYNGLPDDFYKNGQNDANTEDNGYLHIYMNKSLDNGLTVKALDFDAPTGITGGITTVEGLDDNYNYQIAPVTINASGDGYAIGEWTSVTSETTGLAGLYVVRFCSPDGGIASKASEIFYVTGNALNRQALGNLTDEGKLVCKTNTDTWVAGHMAGLSSGIYEQPSGAYASLDQTVGSVTDAQTLWLYQVTKEEANAALETAKTVTYPSWAGTPDASVMQKIIDDFYASKAETSADALAAEKVALQQNIAAAVEKRNFKYAFDNTEIVPVDEALSISLTARKRQGGLAFNAKMIVTFKVMDLDGNVTDYTWTSDEQTYGKDSTGWKQYNIDIQSVLEGAQGYLVGIQINPVGDVDDTTVVSYANTLLAAKAASARFIQSQWQAGWYPALYTVELPAERPALEGIKGGIGAVGGIDFTDGEYQYATLGINKTGDALAASDWAELTADTKLTGLVTIRKVFLDGSVSAASKPVYVYGDETARKTLSNFAENGYIITDKLGDSAAKAFTVGKWAGRQLETHSTLAKNHITSLGSGWINSTHSKAVKDAEAALAALGDDATAEEKAAAQAKVDAARQAVVDRVIDNHITYGYDPTEIVKINELEQFSFTIGKRMGCATYSTKFSSKVSVLIADLEGNVNTYTYFTAPNTNINTSATYNISFTNADEWTPALPAEGYVVALDIVPWYGANDPAKFTFETANTYNTLPSFFPIAESYLIGEPTLVLDPIEADLSDIYMKDGVVKGLDADTAYGYCAVTPEGVSNELTKIPLGTTQLELPAGLWAIRACGDGVLYGNSLPSNVFYIPGVSRGDIIHTETVTCTGMKETSPINGLVVDRILAKAPATYGELEFNKGLWTATHYYSNNLYTYWEQGSPLNLGSTSCPIGTTDICNAITALDADPENADLLATYEELKAKNIALTTSIGYSYQFTEDEIIPMTDFVSHTFKSWCRQTGIAVKSGKFQTKYVLKVALDDGTIVDRVAYKDVSYSYNAGTVITVQLSDFEETDGYIVGMVIYPYGKAVDVELKNGSSPKVNGDVDVMFYADGYRAKAPAPAPEFNIVASTAGVDAVITNHYPSAKYAYSLDNATWTIVPAGTKAFTVVDGETGDTVYVKSLAFDAFYESYVGSAVIPAFKALPALELGEGNVLSDDTGLYEIAKYQFNTDLAYADLTEATLDTGIWFVRTKGDATASASAPQVFYIKGAQAGSINYAFVPSTATFVEGKWTVNKTINMYVPSAANWATAGNVELHTSAPYKSADRRAYSYKYMYEADEIIPANQLADIGASTCGAFYHGYLLDGYTMSDGDGARKISEYGQTLARVYVAGASVDYYDIYTEVKFSTDGYYFAIGEYLSDKPGYVVAIELFPLWSVYGADNKTDLGDDCIQALWLKSASPAKWSDYTFKVRFANQFIENELPEGESLPTGNYGTWTYASNGLNRYAISTSKPTPAAPTLTCSNGGIVKVTNYNKAYKYAYSLDNGDTWVNVDGSSFYAPKANTEILVKVRESGSSYGSEAVAITSSPVVVVGTSLVLDGQIGTKVYLDVDTDVVDINTVKFHVTRVNSDFANVENAGGLYRQYGYCSTAKSDAVGLTNITYDEAKGLYSFIFYMPVKDIDNYAVENELNYNLLDGTEVKAGNIGSNLKVTTYIASAKALAEAGDEAFVEALPLVEALETYATYSDAYFNKKSVPTYRTEAEVNVEAPAKFGSLEGAQFYGTSIILEDQVTIRHYFVASDLEVFKAKYGAPSGTKGGYLYYDITDIAAQDIGKLQKLDIKDAEGNIAFSVSYSVANYIANMMNDTDTRLVNLVNVMYDYYLAAVEYTK